MRRDILPPVRDRSGRMRGSGLARKYAALCRLSLNLRSIPAGWLLYLSQYDAGFGATCLVQIAHAFGPQVDFPGIDEGLLTIRGRKAGSCQRGDQIGSGHDADDTTSRNDRYGIAFPVRHLR